MPAVPRRDETNMLVCILRILRRVFVSKTHTHTHTEVWFFACRHWNAVSLPMSQWIIQTNHELHDAVAAIFTSVRISYFVS